MPKTVVVPEDPFESANKVVSAKFSLPVIMALFRSDGGFGFNQVLREIPGITPRTLSTRLKFLEKLAIVERTVLLSPQMRIRYVLTAKGKELAGAVGPLGDWGKKYPSSTK